MIAPSFIDPQQSFEIAIQLFDGALYSEFTLDCSVLNTASLSAKLLAKIAALSNLGGPYYSDEWIAQVSLTEGIPLEFPLSEIIDPNNFKFSEDINLNDAKAFTTL